MDGTRREDSTPVIPLSPIEDPPWRDCAMQVVSDDEPTSLMLTQVEDPVAAATDDEIIDLEHWHDVEDPPRRAVVETPQLTLILPEDGAEAHAERLTLVKDGDDEPAASGMDSSAFTSFTEWAEQVSGCFSPPASGYVDTLGNTDGARMRKRASRAVAAENLWSSMEPTLHTIDAPVSPASADLRPVQALTALATDASVDAPPRRTSDTASASPATSSDAPVTGGPMTPAPPTPPARIGAGQRVDKRPATADRRQGWKPGNPLAGLAGGVIGGFHWTQMWRIAGATAACGVFLLLLKRIFA